MSSEAPDNTQSAALRRSEAYLAETQRLTGTGSFAIDATRQVIASVRTVLAATLPLTRDQAGRVG